MFTGKVFPLTGRSSVRQKRLYVPLSFFLPFFLMVLAMTALQIVPFGKHNLALTDGRYYINNLMFFARLLKGQENLLYSLKNGLGGNEWSILAWGGFSVGGLLSVFATLETMPAWFSWITLTNLSVCGLTMYLLLAGVDRPRFSHLIFSTSYALMGFNVAYCYHYLFFTGPQLLPLMVLGLVKLMQGKSPLLYILSLAVCIFLNFYFGFMLCAASVLLFAAFLYVNQHELKGKLWQRYRVYMASSVIAGLLAAPMWLPAMKAYSGGGRLNQTGWLEYTFTEKAPFLQIFSKLFSGAVTQTEEVQGLPNIFCGVLVVFLVILYFFDQRNDLSRRRAAGVLLGLYLLSFYIPAFTILMHGGTHTNWFPYRYSFVFSFFLICIAFEEFRHLDELTVQETKKCGIVLFCAALLVFGVKYEFVAAGSLLLDLTLLLLMGMGFYLYKTKPEKASQRTLCLLLAILVSGNLYGNFVISIYKLRDWEKDLKQYSSDILTSGAVVEALNAVETGFFRMEKDVSESETIGADPYLYGYNGVSHSGPAERMFVHQGLSRLGVNWFDMRHWYEAGVPAATDALLGLKYLISQNNLSEEKGYENRLDAEGTSIYENHSALPAAILSNAAAADLELGDNAFDNLNLVWRKMTGKAKNIFREERDVTFSLKNATANQTITAGELKYSTSKSERGEEGNQPTTSYIEYSFRAKQDGPVYAFDSAVPASEDGLALRSIRCCGVYRAGDTVKGHFDINGAEYVTGETFREYCAKVVFAYADNDLLADYAKKLNARDVTFNVTHDNDLNGTFTAEQDQRILFTIPWDEGWKCYVDGAEVPIDKTWDLFMSVEAPEGKHTWEMKFFPAWMDYGLYLSAAALLGLVVLMVLRRRGDEKIPAEVTKK